VRIIFLDFDGVLNSNRYIRSCGGTGLALDPECLKQLKKIVDATDAKIVLTTSWREHWEQDEEKCDPIGKEICEIFSKYQLSVLDKTPFLTSGRESEIESWLDAHSETKTFAVLDDRFLDSPRIRGHFVKTDAYIRGLEKMGAEKAVRILRNE